MPPIPLRDRRVRLESKLEEIGIGKNNKKRTAIPLKPERLPFSKTCLDVCPFYITDNTPFVGEGKLIF